MRLLHILVIGALVAAAAYVYEIKFESTLQAERLAKLRAEIRRERDAIATLRAEWAKLDNPGAHPGPGAAPSASCRPVDATQIDTFDKLPARPSRSAAAGHRRSDRRHHRAGRGRSRPAASNAEAGRADGRRADELRQKPRRTTLIARLLYGANVDRNAKARARVGLAIAVFALRLRRDRRAAVFFGVMSDGAAGKRSTAHDAVATARPDILDRNGEILATDVRTPSLFAEPRKIIDVDEAVELLTATLPDLDASELRERLSSKRGFVWLKREITPKQQQEIHKLGIPGVGFLTENKRVYPNGAVVSHVIGHVNIDNQGIAGIEKWLDARGLADLHMAGFATDRLQKPVELAVDLRVQHALRDELLAAQQKYKVKVAAAGLITDVRTGEVIAMVSVPDYDPNNPREALDPNRINRLTTGVFEMGSTFKALTMAMALDSGKITLGLELRCAAAAAIRKIRDQRLSRAAAHPHGAGDFHLLVQYRHRQDGARARRRASQGVPAQDGPARPADAPKFRKAPSRWCRNTGAS